MNLCLCCIQEKDVGKRVSVCPCANTSMWRLEAGQGGSVNDYPIYSWSQGLLLNLGFANPGYLS